MRLFARDVRTNRAPLRRGEVPKAHGGRERVQGGRCSSGVLNRSCAGSPLSPAVTRLAAARSRSRSDTTLWCHSLRSRRFATSPGEGQLRCASIAPHSERARGAPAKETRIPRNACCISGDASKFKSLHRWKEARARHPSTVRIRPQGRRRRPHARSARWRSRW